MRNALLASLVVATATLGLGGQDHPNFSGVWSVVPSLSVWSDEGRSVNITVFGELFTAEQTQDVLSIAIANEGGFKWIYRVDGAVTRNVPRGPEGPQETSSITVWRGSTLVITTTAVVNRDGAKQERETTRRVTFNKDGTLLVEAPWGRNGAMIGSVYSRVRHRRRPKSVSQRRRACRSNSRCSRAQHDKGSPGRRRPNAGVRRLQPRTPILGERHAKSNSSTGYDHLVCRCGFGRFCGGLFSSFGQARARRPGGPFWQRSGFSHDGPQGRYAGRSTRSTCRWGVERG